MIGLLRYLFGFVDVKVYGETPERLINTCIARGIRIWNVSHYEKFVLFSIMMRDYKIIRLLRKETDKNIKVKLIRKYGLPFRIRKAVSRLGIIVGLIIFASINIYLSNFIWRIEVTGNKSVSNEDILNACKKEGIDIGICINQIDTYNSAHRIALGFKEIAWMSLNIEGSQLTVNISEAERTQHINKNPRNIVATRNGVIKQIEVISGNKNVQIGQTVNKGELLVSGVSEYGNTTHYIASEGVVLAETLRGFSCTVDKSIKFYYPSGKINKRSVLELFGLKIPLFLSKPHDTYDSYLSFKKLSMFGEELPIGSADRYFVLGEIKNKMLNVNEAKSVAIQKFCEEIRNSKVIKVNSCNVDLVEEKDFFRIYLSAVCIEDICEFQSITVTED